MDLGRQLVQLVQFFSERRYLDSPHMSFCVTRGLTYLRQISSRSISTTEDLAGNGLCFLP
jgi:hypothetical protein